MSCIRSTRVQDRKSKKMGDELEGCVNTIERIYKFLRDFEEKTNRLKPKRKAADRAFVFLPRRVAVVPHVRLWPSAIPGPFLFGDWNASDYTKDL